MENHKKPKPSPIPYRAIFLGAIITLIAGIVIAVWLLAPTTTSLQPATSAETAARAACLKNEAGDCLILPAVTGIDLDSQSVAIPAVFPDGLLLVVMPFDRDQQVLAVTWLPLFQELANTYEDVSFFNIAALPDLNAGVRLLVIGGMQAGMRDPEIREKTAVLFLQDQRAFLDALMIENTDQIQVFIVDESGTVFWRGAGEFNEAISADIRAALSELH